MKGIGAVVYCTNQGLGIEAKDFFDHGIFTEALIQKHSTYTNNWDWYPNRVNNFDELLEKCHTIYFFETPFDFKYILRAREKGVKTILVVHYECTRLPPPYFPDVLVAPSDIDFDYCNKLLH